MSKLISDIFKEWEKHCDERLRKQKGNEEKLNRFFILHTDLKMSLLPKQSTMI